MPPSTSASKDRPTTDPALSTSRVSGGSRSMRDMSRPWTLSGISRAASSAARATDDAPRMRVEHARCLQ